MTRKADRREEHGVEYSVDGVTYHDYEDNIIYEAKKHAIIAKIRVLKSKLRKYHRQEPHIEGHLLDGHIDYDLPVYEKTTVYKEDHEHTAVHDPEIFVHEHKHNWDKGSFFVLFY